ncbi:MAG: sensor domain-containing diguanylate cyclase [Gammaproteobacteria bacterium]|nr:sensor domain-containing diguanylate cyclase [Gammaproteobacteria bacterium]MCF6259333.1 sensor domain-containing diguanylate cyclase [Gammaproteobacteria bacterium]
MQVSNDLYHENQLLRRKLREFLSQARENEQKQRRFHEQELRLISTPSLTELLQRLLFNYRTAFRLDTVSLVLHDPEYEIQRILEEEGVRLEEMEQLLFQHDADSLDNLFGVSAEPRLGKYRKHEHRFLFAENTTRLHSVALLPLVRYGKVIGSLNLGSTQEGRYLDGAATDFLQRLATVVAICVENATNHERLKRVGLTDSLTGVNNRRFFDQRLQEEVGRAQRSNEPLTCLFMDVDHFKKVNDQHGHQTGDQVLRVVAGLIREQLRASDVLGRYGGEEFAALLVNAPSEAAMEIAERIRAVIEAHLFRTLEGESLSATISIGVASLQRIENENDPSVLATGLVDRADQAVYSAKNQGRNRVVLEG